MRTGEQHEKLVDPEIPDSEDGFESPELEAAMLKALDSPRRPMDDAFFESIRASWPSRKAEAARKKLS